MQDTVVEEADVTLPDVRAVPEIIAIPDALRVVGVRCDLSSELLLDVLLDEGLSDCDNWEQVVKIHGQFATLPPDAMLVVEPRARGVEALTPELLAWHEKHHALIRLDCSASDLPEALVHVECDAPIGDMITLTNLPGLESLALSWSSREEARAGMASMGEDYDDYMSKGKELPYTFNNFDMIKELQTLQRLWLDPAELDGDRLAAILKLEALTWLDLTTAHLFGSGPAISGGAWIGSIGSLSKLRTLALDGSYLADSDLVYLTDLHELRALSLDGLQRNCAPNDHLGRHIFTPGDRSDYPCRRKPNAVSFLKRLSNLKHLHLLSLKDTKLEGQFIEDVNHLKSLRVLAIQVDEAKQLRLGGLTHLESLTLAASEPRIPWVGCTLGYSDEERLEYFNQETRPMRDLMVAWDPKWFDGVTKLRVLEVKHLKMDEQEVRALALHGELRGLHIVESSVGDAILSDARLTSSLKTLTLDKTCLSEAGLARARQLVPEPSLLIGHAESTREVEHHRLSSRGEIEVARREVRRWFDDYCEDSR